MLKVFTLRIHVFGDFRPLPNLVLFLPSHSMNRFLRRPEAKENHHFSRWIPPWVSGGFLERSGSLGLEWNWKLPLECPCFEGTPLFVA